jgi:hypothetical protein
LAPPAIFATIRTRLAPSLSICRTSSSMPVSANFAILCCPPVIALLSGNMICTRPPILFIGSLIAIPTQEPSPKVITPSGLLQVFKSAIPTLIISLMLHFHTLLSVIFAFHDESDYIIAGIPKAVSIFPKDSRSGIRMKYPSICRLS